MTDRGGQGGKDSGVILIIIVIGIIITLTVYHFYTEQGWVGGYTKEMYVGDTARFVNGWSIRVDTIVIASTNTANFTVNDSYGNFSHNCLYMTESDACQVGDGNISPIGWGANPRYVKISSDTAFAGEHTDSFTITDLYSSPTSATPGSYVHFYAVVSGDASSGILYINGVPEDMNFDGNGIWSYAQVMAAAGVYRYNVMFAGYDGSIKWYPTQSSYKEIIVGNSTPTPTISPHTTSPPYTTTPPNSTSPPYTTIPPTSPPETSPPWWCAVIPSLCGSDQPGTPIPISVVPETPAPLPETDPIPGGVCPDGVDDDVCTVFYKDGTYSESTSFLIEGEIAYWQALRDEDISETNNYFHQESLDWSYDLGWLLTDEEGTPLHGWGSALQDYRMIKHLGDGKFGWAYYYIKSGAKQVASVPTGTHWVRFVINKEGVLISITKPIPISKRGCLNISPVLPLKPADSEVGSITVEYSGTLVSPEDILSVTGCVAPNGANKNLPGTSGCKEGSASIEFELGKNYPIVGTYNLEDICTTDDLKKGGKCQYLYFYIYVEAYVGTINPYLTSDMVPTVGENEGGNSDDPCTNENGNYFGTVEVVQSYSDVAEGGISCDKFLHPDEWLEIPDIPVVEDAIRGLAYVIGFPVWILCWISSIISMIVDTIIKFLKYIFPFPGILFEAII